MEAFQKRTGKTMTYEKLAAMTGLSRSTLESIGTRSSYNASLNTIAKICHALDCSPGDLLELSKHGRYEVK